MTKSTVSVTVIGVIFASKVQWLLVVFLTRLVFGIPVCGLPIFAFRRVLEYKGFASFLISHRLVWIILRAISEEARGKFAVPDPVERQSSASRSTAELLSSALRTREVTEARCLASAVPAWPASRSRRRWFRMVCADCRQAVGLEEHRRQGHFLKYDRGRYGLEDAGAQLECMSLGMRRLRYEVKELHMHYVNMDDYLASILLHDPADIFDRTSPEYSGSPPIIHQANFALKSGV
ncbi:hypothetical protein B0H21DRAFT_710599 [Amylocystis lapponica]|nr:hypothetical protein B0H21DRAFT_710599 [Amylocystis lapponica]